jgi:hypothetical protein
MSIWTILFVILLIAWLGGFAVFHGRWWLDSLITCLGSDLLKRSFCNGENNCINAWPADRSPFETSCGSLGRKNLCRVLTSYE